MGRFHSGGAGSRTAAPPEISPGGHRPFGSRPFRLRPSAHFYFIQSPRRYGDFARLAYDEKAVGVNMEQFPDLFAWKENNRHLDFSWLTKNKKKNTHLTNGGKSASK